MPPQVPWDVGHGPPFNSSVMPYVMNMRDQFQTTLNAGVTVRRVPPVVRALSAAVRVTGCLPMWLSRA